MACTLCSCDDHLNQPCSTCLNCVGHYEQAADHDEDHTDDSNTERTVHHTKSHYRYNARTGEVREVSDIVVESRGAQKGATPKKN